MVMRHEQESKTRLLDATLRVVRAKGYSASRIGDVCAEAGLTLFQHFKSKEGLALAAMAHWDAHAPQIFAAAPDHDAGNPLGRLIAYIEFRKAILTGELPDFTCIAGTVIREAYQTHPDVSAACELSISTHAETLEADVRAAMRDHGIRGTRTPDSLALRIQAVIRAASFGRRRRTSRLPAAVCGTAVRHWAHTPTESHLSKKHRRQQRNGGQHARSRIP
jgi:TetR/AcrR family transcriptional repressor of nem operon